MWTETKYNESPLGKLKCHGRFSIPRKPKLDFRLNLIPGSFLLAFAVTQQNKKKT